ncbi:MAG: branched-chain amino acid ABC transporter permease [Acidimicrobiales bacterium]
MTAPDVPAVPATRRWLPLVGLLVVTVVLIALPQMLNEFWTSRITGWIPLAIAALGLNLLTGYNGQISVGHGALYGIGAYTTALILNDWKWPYLAAIAASAVVCFVAGVAVGLPALRIKGLYLALVTLAVATLFPQILEQTSSWSGGSAGLGITTRELNSRGVLSDRAIRFEAPSWSGLAADQWRYYFFLVIAAVCFLVVRNIVNSRAGRSIIAIRDNETAAEVSGVNVAAAKVFTFGVSAALAGIGGSLLALYLTRVSSGSFTLLISLNFLVAVVIGGTPSIIGPAIGAVFIGVFTDVITPELSESIKPTTPLILGVLLIVLMLVAPGGIVGMGRQLAARTRAMRDRSATTT